jgi:hypothetical protein
MHNSDRYSKGPISGAVATENALGRWECSGTSENVGNHGASDRTFPATTGNAQKALIYKNLQ